MTRNELMKKIQELSFAQAEVQLFLDTHEDNAAALDEFYRYREELRTATEEYEAKFGPLTADGVNGDRYSFCDMPWPWQNTTEGKEG